MFSTRQRCGHCQQLADLPLVFVSLYNRRKPAPDKAVAMRMQLLGERDRVTACGLGMCPLCGQPSVILFECERHAAENIRISIGQPETLLGGAAMISVTGAFPKPIVSDDHSHWPDKARRLYSDADMMLREGKSPILIIGACRAILEAAVKDLGATGGNLKSKIDDLLAKRVVTQPLADWSHRVRVDGNAALHEIEGTETDAVELLDFVRMFLDMCFTLPKAIAAKSQASTPAPS